MPKEKLFIARIVSQFYPKKGGSITHVIELIINMHPFFASQLIISPDYDYDCSSFDKNFIAPIVRVKNEFIKSKLFKKVLGASLINNLYYSYIAMGEIKKLILNGHKIDLVYVHNMTLGLFSLLSSKILNLNIPVVIVHHHGSPFSSGDNRLRGRVHKLIILFLTYFLKPDHYIQLNDGVSDKMFLLFLSKIGVNYTIVNHAIDTSFYKSINNNNNSINDDYIILSNHRLDSFKKVDLAIKSFKIFLDKIQSTTSTKKTYLKIVGSGPQLNELKYLAKHLNIHKHVVFVGEVSSDEMVNEIISSDVIIGTSLISNMNRSIQEAMSCGKPVVIFGTPFENNLFKNMKNSIIVDFGNLDQFADSLRLLFENKELRDFIGKNAELSIKLERNWATRIDQELAICAKIHSSSVNQ